MSPRQCKLCLSLQVLLNCFRLATALAVTLSVLGPADNPRDTDSIHCLAPALGKVVRRACGVPRMQALHRA
jgi:hypothetical protein